MPKNRFWKSISSPETLRMNMVYKKQTVARLVIREIVLLIPVQNYNTISIYAKSVEQASPKNILVSCIITNFQKLQQTKLTWSVQLKILRAGLQTISFDRAKDCKSTNMLTELFPYMNKLKIVLHRKGPRVITQKVSTFEKMFRSVPYGSRSKAKNSTWTISFRTDIYMVGLTVVFNIM